MSQASQPRKSQDVWYVRLPDGQVIRARSTEAVRHHVRTGRIPRNSQVRRAPDEEWTALEWTQEFTAAASARMAPPHEHAEGPPPPRRPGSSPDLPPLGIAGRLDPLRLQTVGVRGLGEELLAALDSTLVRGKLVIAALAGLLLALLGSGLGAVLVRLDTPAWLTLVAVAAVDLIVLAVAGALIARMTYVELSRLRPARWSEVTKGLRPVMARLVVLGLLGPGVAVALIGLLHWGVDQLAGALARAGLAEEPAAALVTTATAAGMVVEVILWLVAGVGLLLWPIAVTEEVGVGESLRLWLRLLREYRGRVVLFEALALVVGALMALPFALPVYLATDAHSNLAGYPVVLALVRNALYGLAAAPLFAYLMVANVFIYLYLRYEAQE